IGAPQGAASADFDPTGAARALHGGARSSVPELSGTDSLMAPESMPENTAVSPSDLSRDSSANPHGTNNARATLGSQASRSASNARDGSANLLDSLSASESSSERTSTSRSPSFSGSAASTGSTSSSAAGISLPSLGLAPDVDSSSGSMKDLVPPP